MTVSITFGWWLLPLAWTAVAFAWALWPRDDEKPTGSMFDGLAEAMGLMVRLPTAAALALAGWLVWALV